MGIRSPRDPFPPPELTGDEIATLVKAFGETALDLKLSGHDGVEIHGAHGYLVAQFLSPATNRRGDQYGGTVVVQTGRSPVNSLQGKLQLANIEHHAIGDCITPRRMSHAVFEAHRLAGTL